MRVHVKFAHGIVITPWFQSEQRKNPGEHRNTRNVPQGSSLNFYIRERLPERGRGNGFHPYYFRIVLHVVNFLFLGLQCSVGFFSPLVSCWFLFFSLFCWGVCCASFACSFVSCVEEVGAVR